MQNTTTIYVPIEQKIDKAYLAQQEKEIIEYLKDKFGLLKTSQGEEILRKMRQIQLVVDQQLKGQIEFKKYEQNTDYEDLQQLQIKVGELKIQQKEEFKKLGDLQEQLKLKVQNSLRMDKLKQCLEQIENEDFRELIIDEKSLDEILHNRFIYNLNKNQELVNEQVEQLEYAQIVYENLHSQQKQLQQRLKELELISELQ